MKLVSIRASAGRTFNHPSEQYANFRHDFTIEATLGPEEQTPETANLASIRLRLTVEEIAENHKRDLLSDIEREQNRETLETQLRSARRWPERVEKINQRLMEFDAWRHALRDWDIMPESARTNLSSKIMAYQNWSSDPAALSDELDQRIAAAERNIKEEKEAGPWLVSSLTEQLLALPPLRLLPGATEPEIHPGHPEHPDTTEDYPCHH